MHKFSPRVRNLSALLFLAAILMTSALHYQEAAIPASATVTGFVAIIIDDFGNNGEGTEEMLKVGIPLTAAVMPFMPYSIKDAEAAKSAGMEVILHIPMEPLRGKPHWLGPHAITSNLSEQQVTDIINQAMTDIPSAVGANNHMGSKITQDRRLMKAVLETIKSDHMYYVDSKTTANSIVDNVATELAVPFLTRDVFLDNVKNQKSIEKQLDLLADVALKKGYAVGIGHVGPEGGTITARAIKSKYQELTDRGVKFVYVTELIKLMEEKHKANL